jgi:hypothetical protein
MRNPKLRPGAACERLHRSTTSIPAALILAIMLLAAPLTGCGAEQKTENQPPTLALDVGAQENYVVGDMVRIRASAEDPDGDALSFEVVGIPTRAELQTFPNSALLSWDPIASDVTADELLRLIFVVEDGRGGRAERVVNLEIAPGNGTPEFLSPSSKLFDPSGGQALEFDVEVRDDDSNQVILTMPTATAPEGAEFEQVGPKSAHFSWTPTAEQLGRRVHSVIFVADDDQGAPVEQEVTIILQNSGGDDPAPAPAPTSTCEADQPIAHAAPGPQRALADYELQAHLSSDAAQKYDTGFVFWSTDDPMNREVEFGSVEMKVDGALMRAAIPNLLLAPGESETIYYTICAMDSTASADDPEGFICAPPAYYYSFVAYSPDSAICADDSNAGANFADAAPVPDDHWGAYLTCPGSSDFHTVTVPAGGLAEIYLLYSRTQNAVQDPMSRNLEVTVYDDAHKERDLAQFSECEGIAYIALDAPQSTSKTWYIEVGPGDAGGVPYQMGAIISGPACVDDDLFGAQNHDPANAAPISTGTYGDLTLCPDQPDLYFRAAQADSLILAELIVEEGPAIEDVYLVVYDSQGEYVDEAVVDGNRLTLDFVAPQTDTYLYRVISPAQTRYTLTFVDE